MDSVERIYFIFWMSSLLMTVSFLFKNWNLISFTQNKYWLILFQPWKLITFTIALLGITLMAPYTGDPTWDYISASLMSLLTFCAAPWAVDIFYRSLQKKENFSVIFIAINFLAAVHSLVL
jgi:hypothetical protein